MITTVQPTSVDIPLNSEDLQPLKSSIKDKSVLLEFRDKISNNKLLKLCHFEDDLLEKFLFSRNGNVKAAFNALLLYVTIVKNNEDMVRWPENLMKTLNSNVYRLLKARDNHGNPIVAIRIPNYDPKTVDAKDIIRAGIITYETLYRDPINYRKQVSCLIDASEMTIAKIWSIGYTLGRLVSELTDQAMPFAVCKVHVCYENWLIDMAYGLFKPFMSQELRERILFHGTNVDEIKKYCPTSTIPPDFGGTNDLDWNDDEVFEYFNKFKPEIEKHWRRLRSNDNNNIE